MSFLEYLTGEKFRLITDLIISCGGFLMALYINTALDRRRERREFKSLFTCVAGEAISNRLILHEGFLAFLDEGIITRPLTTICVESAISSALFARYACAADYTIIMRYLRQLILLNGNRQMHYDLSLSNDEQNLLPELARLMRERITEAERIIQEVAARAS